MNIEQLDEKLVSTPLSKEKRIEYIKLFYDKRFLQGIDKGTSLERSRKKRINELNEKKFDKYFQQFAEYIEEIILISEKRVYREKYKGRYNYYKPKKKYRKKKIKPPEPIKKLKQNTLW